MIVGWLWGTGRGGCDALHKLGTIALALAFSEGGRGIPPTASRTTAWLRMNASPHTAVVTRSSATMRCVQSLVGLVPRCCGPIGGGGVALDRERGVRCVVAQVASRVMASADGLPGSGL